MRLRKIKGASEILAGSNYYIKAPEQYKGNWEQVFKQKQPIYIEIGMGKGKFIIANALKYPQLNFIGIDKQASILVKAIKKLETFTLPNLKIICCDVLNLENIFKQEVERLYLNFSDPWPKQKHQKRRLTNPLFLKKYEQIFKKDQVIFLKTDKRDFFLYSLTSFQDNNYEVRNICYDLNQSLEQDNITTEYEDKFRALKHPIYRLEAYKKGKRSK